MTTELERGAERARVRLLEAAAPVIARRPGSSMTDIARAAGVARSTLHRHFPERNDLLTALEDHASAAVATAALRARLDEGDGRAAVLRMCVAYFEVGDLIFAASFGRLTPEQELESVRDETDEALARVIARGHDDGSIDARLSVVWIEQALWSLLYTAWLTANSDRTTRHEALTLFLRSFEKMLAADTG